MLLLINIIRRSMIRERERNGGGTTNGGATNKIIVHVKNPKETTSRYG